MNPCTSLSFALLPFWRRALGEPSEHFFCMCLTLIPVKSFKKLCSVPLQVPKKNITITIRSMNILLPIISCFADRSSMFFFGFCQGFKRSKFLKVFIRFGNLNGRQLYIFNEDSSERRHVSVFKVTCGFKISSHGGSLNYPTFLKGAL